MESTQAGPALSTPPKRVKRHTVVIKKALQYKFVGLVLAAVFVGVCIMAWDLYFTFGKDIVRDLMDPGLYELFQEINKVLLAKLVIYFVIVGFVALFLSHRIAGPIFRFEKGARIVTGGDLTERIHLRKGDELNDLQDAFNKMMESIHGRVSQDRASAQKIAQELESLKGSPGLPADAQKKISELQSQVKALTDEFKL